MPLSNNDYLIEKRQDVTPGDDGNLIEWNDSKIRFITEKCRGKSVLDLGCVQHDPLFAQTKLWLHKAIKSVASDVVGLDLSESGILKLEEMGYENLVVADAQDYYLGRKFDVIVAGDLIEHLHNVGGFLESCREHMGEKSKLLICTPNPWHWHKWARAFWRDVPVNEEHTMWLCPKTLDQVARRFRLSTVNLEYGSSRLKDSFLPLPRRVKHSTFYAVLEKY